MSQWRVCARAYASVCREALKICKGGEGRARFVRPSILAAVDCSKAEHVHPCRVRIQDYVERGVGTAKLLTQDGNFRPPRKQAVQRCRLL